MKKFSRKFPSLSALGLIPVAIMRLWNQLNLDLGLSYSINYMASKIITLPL